MPPEWVYFFGMKKTKITMWRNIFQFVGLAFKIIEVFHFNLHSFAMVSVFPTEFIAIMNK